MNKTDSYTMKNGSILTIINGYRGEKDFYLMYDIIDQLIHPDDSGYSVDSMCVGGYFVKDGIRVRTSSESPYDYMSFFYQPGDMSEEEVKRVEGWIEAVADELRRRQDPVEYTDDDDEW